MEPELWEVHVMMMGSTRLWLSYELEKTNKIYALM
jgi:hypothetical protein